LKYLNCSSTHTETCFAAIPAWVMKRLASLTTRTDESELMRMDQLYPAHTTALQTAGLAPDIFPTLAKSSTTNKWTQLSMTTKERRTTKTQELYDFA
jgi:hypothetical protein